jgi:hypothetical protein
MVSSRRIILGQIMRIEKKIQKINKSYNFKKINENIKILESKRGSRSIQVNSPENYDSTIELRRNSERAQEIAENYKDQRRKYMDRLESLEVERARLKKELFR